MHSPLGEDYQFWSGAKVPTESMARPHPNGRIGLIHYFLVVGQKFCHHVTIIIYSIHTAFFRLWHRQLNIIF